MPKLLLLDGNSLAYRAFFALPTDMATASGQVTNAVFGFTSMLVNLLKDHHPDGIAVAFDRPEPTFRHDLVDGYKAGRAAAPDILRQQMGLVRQVVETLRIPVVEVPGFEADDVIGTLATQARDRGDDVIIVTGDRDTYQLVEDPHVRVLYNRRGVSDYVLYDEAGIQERTGVTPAQYPQYAALRGDPSDNLPGVPGVGEKTAARLITGYGDLDGVFAHLDELTPKLRETLAVHESRVRINAQATPLVRDVAISYEVDDLRMGGWDGDEVRRLFGFLEFRTLWDRLVEAVGEAGGGFAGPGQGSGTLDVEDVAVARLRDAEAAAALLDELRAAGTALAVEAAWRGQAGRSALTGLALVPAVPAASPAGEPSAPDGAVTAHWLDLELLTDPAVGAALASLVGPGGPPLHAHRAKELMRGLSVLGVDVRTLDLDTVVAAYLVDPAESQYLLEDLAPRYAGIELRSPDAPPPGQLDLEGTGADPAEEAARRAAAVARLVVPLSAALDARGLRPLYDDVERPLVRVLARMEEVGVRVDAEYLRGIVATLTDDTHKLDGEIQDLAGHPFVVNSTKQLRAVLFEELGLEPQKKTKTGFSTDAASLEKLRGQHPIVEKLLRYREAEKLRSTYGDSLLAEVAPDGRIHASFNQTVARTGRLSSDQPNLHNIPIRSEEGRQFRRAFVPADDCRFLIADYNQIELRVIAHLAQDPGLIEAFRSGHDVHRATASRIFSVEPGTVTLAQRAKAKMVSYGLAYGMEAYGLSQRLGIPVEEAAEILSAYFAAFPNVRDYMDRTVREARTRGYTETLFGRRRLIPELSSSNYRVRQAGERQAMNAGIQGLAADIFKVALVRLDRGLEEEKLASRLVLQVHDEVILEVPPEEEGRASELTLDAMRGACDLCVDLEVNLSWGSDWAEAKG
ncbi:MAG TPA: DNA polymerase I [Acidimicrobiales bacterium]|nr:DNA polymerase I [Acidimicrobiales bacterium]